MANVAVISGAGRGIGRATAEALAQTGMHVVLAARTPTEITAVAAAIMASGGTATAVPCDVTDEAQVEALIATAAAINGHIDAVIANAGVAHVAPFTTQSLADWETTIRVTLTGTFLLCKHAVAHMGAGSQIITVGSIASRTAFPNWAAYSAAKFGLLGFTNAMREELRDRGLRVTTVLPGAVDTGLWDTIPGEWNRAHMLQPSDVAQAIAQALTTPPHLSVDEIILSSQKGKL